MTIIDLPTVTSMPERPTVDASEANVTSWASPRTTPELSDPNSFMAPEQEWCKLCALESATEDPGVAQDIIDISIEVDVRSIDGTGDEYLVHHLACGHQTCIPLKR